MKSQDAGHTFSLDNYHAFAEQREVSTQTLYFMKRVGERYPGNEAPPYPGTNTQEVLRALIARAIYLNGQIPCAETEAAIGHLRSALLLFEIRAARVHDRTLALEEVELIEAQPTCRTCGHLQCELHSKTIAEQDLRDR